MANQPMDCAIHALLDNQLEASDRQEVLQTIKANPNYQARARDYVELNTRLVQLNADVLDEPLPQSLQNILLGDFDVTVEIGADDPTIVEQKARLDDETAETQQFANHNVVDLKAKSSAPSTKREKHWRLAAGLAWLCLGVVAGWNTMNWVTDGKPADIILSSAIDAHRVFSKESRHAVEVAALDKDHLMKWLSKRLGNRVGPADLTDVNFTLLGGRLLPVPNGHAGLYLYENDRARLSVFISSVQDENLPTEIQCSEHHNLSVCAWRKENLAIYLLAPTIIRVEEIADLVDEQIPTPKDQNFNTKENTLLRGLFPKTP